MVIKSRLVIVVIAASWIMNATADGLTDGFYKGSPNWEDPCNLHSTNNDNDTEIILTVADPRKMCKRTNGVSYHFVACTNHESADEETCSHKKSDRRPHFHLRGTPDTVLYKKGKSSFEITNWGKLNLDIHYRQFHSISGQSRYRGMFALTAAWVEAARACKLYEDFYKPQFDECDFSCSDGWAAQCNWHMFID